MRLFLGKIIRVDRTTRAATGEAAYAAVMVNASGEPEVREGPYSDVAAMTAAVQRVRRPEAHHPFHLAEGFTWEPPKGEHCFGEHVVVRFEALPLQEMWRAQTILGLT